MKKANRYAEIRLPKIKGKKVDGWELLRNGSYGERRCNWILIYFTDKTQIRLPVIPDYLGY